MGIFKGARADATAAAVGNLLQGWDNAAVAGRRTHTHTPLTLPLLLLLLIIKIQNPKPIFSTKLELHKTHLNLLLEPSGVLLLRLFL
jgi:hypothetical protein